MHWSFFFGSGVDRGSWWTRVWIFFFSVLTKTWTFCSFGGRSVATFGSWNKLRAFGRSDTRVNFPTEYSFSSFISSYKMTLQNFERCIEEEFNSPWRLMCDIWFNSKVERSDGPLHTPVGTPNNQSMLHTPLQDYDPKSGKDISWANSTRHFLNVATFSTIFNMRNQMTKIKLNYFI